MFAEISRALEERDQMEGHGMRVAALAELVAVRLGWDAERLATLRLGAPIHDIGKLAAPRDVLRKPGPLTESERAEIRCHPHAGALLVRSVDRLRVAVPCVLFHHERWDGGGYPAGIHGHAIPLEARILAVADAFDAMTSARPYRRALPADVALEEIAHCSGTQFDPVVAGVFLELWDERHRELRSLAV